MNVLVLNCGSSSVKFQIIATDLDRIAQNADRRLARGIIEQIPAEDGTKRMAYRLTKKGKALGPILKAMRNWGISWDKSTARND